MTAPRLERPQLGQPRIDALQYCAFDEKIFRELRAGGLDAIHVTVAYHETFAEVIDNLIAWNRHFERHRDLILPGRTVGDVVRARESGRTAVFFGFQNPAPIAEDLGRVEICHQLGIRFMQLTYNNQSLLGAGCYEPVDSGLTRFGREVVREMNRVGLVIDLSHAGQRTVLDAIDASERPVTITHANPKSWRDVPRNLSDDVLRALAQSGGQLGFSLYPHHLAAGSDCTLAAFCEMVARTAELTGTPALGIGSDLCQGQPDTVVEWMRTGRWQRPASLVPDEDAVKKPAALPSGGFPQQPAWFRTNADFGNLETGLRAVGFSADDVDAILGGNWLRFFAMSFLGAQEMEKYRSLAI